MAQELEPKVEVSLQPTAIVISKKDVNHDVLYEEVIPKVEVSLQPTAIVISKKDVNQDVLYEEVIPIQFVKMTTKFPKHGATGVNQYVYIELKYLGVTILTISNNPETDLTSVDGELNIMEAHRLLHKSLCGK
jgi:hypothetical protein